MLKRIAERLERTSPGTLIAISVYVLVAIVKKRLNLDKSLYTILQILSVTLFEKTPILQALSYADYRFLEGDDCNQLNLFNS